MKRFSGKVAIVTGGASGIGEATAARLAAEGASVLVVDRSEPAALPAGAVWQRADVTRSDEVAALVDAAMRRWGRLDILVNNAGVGAASGTPWMEEQEWDRVFAINTRAIFLLCRAAIPRMEEGSAIINVASISGLAGDHGMDAYNASKGAVVNYTRSLAVDCAALGIRVNALCPGLVETPMSAPAITDPEDRAFWFGRIPMKRPARPAEMAGVIAFLASDDASYMTGSIVVSDGGLTAHTGQPDTAERRRLRALRQG